MVFGDEEAQRHVVVFDCNVYLDVACLLGEPFSWEKFDTAAARAVKTPVPHPLDSSVDSVRAIAACTSGLFAGDETVEVWTNAHIDKIVRGKAVQSPIADQDTGYRGLGWSAAGGSALVTDLILGIAQRSNGGTLGDHYPDETLLSITRMGWSTERVVNWRPRTRSPMSTVSPMTEAFCPRGRRSASAVTARSSRLPSSSG
jgi:hypothetical protein